MIEREISEKDLRSIFGIPLQEVEKILGEETCWRIRQTASMLAEEFIGMKIPEEKLLIELASCLSAAMFKGANIMACRMMDDDNEKEKR